MNTRQECVKDAYEHETNATEHETEHETELKEHNSCSEATS